MQDERTVEEITENIRDVITNSPLPLEEIATTVNISRGEALECCDNIKAKQKGLYFYLGRLPESFKTETSVQAEVSLKGMTAKNKRLKKVNEQLTADLEKLQKFDSFELILKESCLPPISPPHDYIPPEKEETTALLCLSDWHIGEKVDPDTVGGVNEFDSTIAEQRAMRLFVQTRAKLQTLKETEPLTDLVVWLGGDFISGYIHQELEESNTMSPPEESLFMISLLKEGFRILSEVGLPITVITSFGNHGRTSLKKKHSTGAVNNFEYLVYNFLKDSVDLPISDWVLSKSTFSYLHLYGRTIRFHHGDNVQAKTRNNFCSSVLKKVDQLNQQKEADLDVFGHFHTLHFHPKFICNGSLIGPSPFSINLGFPPEPPQQALALLSSLHPGFVKASYSLAPALEYAAV